MSLIVREVAAHEVAYFVLRYLQEHNFQNTSKAFAIEAESLLRLVQPPAANQQVKGLPAVLNEYVALEARARRRSEFERAFGDDYEVRECLSKLGTVMDHYLAAADRSQMITCGSSSSSCAGGSRPSAQGRVAAAQQPRMAHASASAAAASSALGVAGAAAVRSAPVLQPPSSDP